MKQKRARLIQQILRVLRVDGLIISSYHRVLDYYLELRYSNKNTLQLNIDDITVTFSTEDSYSKRWFLPCYSAASLYEEPVTRLIADRMAVSKCFVDVGAHIGYYTCLASKIMTGGMIYGFEMDEQNYALLVRNLELNECRNTYVMNTAISDISGTIRYIRHHKFPSAGFSLASDLERDHRYGDLVSVDAITLDCFFKNHEAMPDLIKIDVEGAELKVLLGAEHILKSTDVTLFVEVHPEKIHNFQSTVRQVIWLLLDHGYDVSEMSKKGSELNLRPLSRESDVRHDAILYAHK